MKNIPTPDYSSTNIYPGYCFKDEVYFPSVTVQIQYVKNNMMNVLLMMLARFDCHFSSQEQAQEVAEKDYDIAFKKHKLLSANDREAQIFATLHKIGYVPFIDEDSTYDNKFTVH